MIKIKMIKITNFIFIKLLLFLFYIKKTIHLNAEEEINLPEEYDLRNEYSECESLKLIRKQGNCGGCWAFAVAEVISDRICINSKGQNQTILSETELLTCCYFCFNLTNIKKGCSGGTENSAFLYWVTYGLPTESCKSFFLIEEYDINNIKCKNKCDDGSKPEYFVGSDYRYIHKNEKEIMKEIYKYGSVTAYFEVYEDFNIYWNDNKSIGIYEFTPIFEYKGLHVIKIIGWGTELINGKKIKYWLCANSWKTDESHDGFFKFKRGENQCNIEFLVYAGYMNSKIIHRNQESIIVFENHFFNLQNLNKDFR